MKRILICSTLIFIFLAFGSLPSFFSSEAGKNILVNWINRNISGELSVDKLNLSWLSKQQIQNLKLKDNEGREILSLPFFETRTSLLYLLLGGRSFNDTVLHQPYLFLEQKDKEPTNLEKALSREVKKIKPKKQKVALPQFKNKLNVKDGTLVLSSSKIKPITISEIAIDKHPEPDAFHVSAKTEQGAIRGNLLFTTSFSKILQIQANIKNFPVAVLDQFFETSLFTEGLGSTFNANFYLSKGESAIRVEGNVTSELLNALIKGDTYDNRFYLDPDTRLKFTVTPTFFSSLISPSQKELWKLVSKTDLNFQIEKGIFPLNLKSKADFQEIVFQGVAHMQKAEIAHPTLGKYALNPFEFSIIMLNNLEIAYKGEIKGKESTEIEGNLSITPDKKILFNYDCKNFPVSMINLFPPKVAENLHFIFGKTCDVAGSGTYVEKMVNTDFSVCSSSLLLKGAFEGKYPNFSFKLGGNSKVLGGKAKFLGSSVDFQAEGKLNTENKELSLPSFGGKLSSTQLNVDFKGKIGEEGKPFSYKNVYLTSTGSIKLLENLDKLSPKEATFFIQADGSKNLIVGKAEAPLESDVSRIHFEANNLIQNEALSIDEAEINFDADLDRFPTEILQSFTQGNLSLAKFIGDKLTLKAEGKWSPKKDPKAVVTLNAKGVGFQTSLSFIFDKTLKILQNKPSYLYWELTPERYKALLTASKLDPNYSPKYLLGHTAPIELKISQLNFPASFPENVSGILSNSGFVGDLEIGALVFKNLETKESFLIQKISGSITGEELYKQINLSLHGSFSPSNLAKSEKSSFSFKGQLLNVCTPKGKINREQMAIMGEIDLNRLPVRELSDILPLKEDLRKTTQALLGDFVNAKAYGEISKQKGPFSIEINASNFKARFPLYISPQAIVLSDNIEAELTLTDQVNETLIKDINPLLITGAFSEHPIKVYIEKEGFSIPIKPFKFRDILIEKGIIDIGKIRVRNGGHIQSLMEFLKAKDISENHEMDAWFTPIFFTLKEGVVGYKRFDALLAGNVHNALWGEIDLIKDKVHMTLGIAPTTLKQRFNILGISKKDMFQVKMRGTTEKLDLDWSSAYTRIGILIARAAGGPYGYIIGGIVEQLVNLLGEEPTPEPTTYPLPWSNDGDQDEFPKEEIPQETPPPTKTGKKFFKKLLQFLIP